MLIAKQNTAFEAAFLLKDLASGFGLTGVATSVSVQIAKYGASGFGSIAPTITELGFGWYKMSLTTSHMDTLGVSKFHIACPGAFNNDEVTVDVQAIDPHDSVRGGMTALPNADSGSSGGLIFTMNTIITNINTAITDINGLPSAAANAAAVWADVLEGSLTAMHMMRIILSEAANNATGLGTGNPKFKSADGAKDRISGTISGANRTTTVDGT